MERQHTLAAKNYDLHNILGFYISWLVVIIAITGIVFGIQWFKQGLYTGLGGRSRPNSVCLTQT